MTSIANLEKKSNEYSIRLHIQANAITDYDSFISWTHDVLIYSIQKVEAKRDLLCIACENTITAFIQISIDARGKINNVTSNTEGHYSGHCDLNISWGNYVWHGEAKIYKGSSYILEGYNQLTERYFSGSNAYNYSGILIYFQEPMKNKINDYKSMLQESKSGLEIDDSIFPDYPLYFNAKHEHPQTGLPINIIHFPINLDHQSREKKEARQVESLRKQAELLIAEADKIEQKNK